MKEWWKRKKERSRKFRKRNDHYTFFDFVLDVLFWIPELFLLPFRLIFWLLQIILRSVGNLLSHW